MIQESLYDITIIGIQFSDNNTSVREASECSSRTSSIMTKSFVLGDEYKIQLTIVSISSSFHLFQTQAVLHPYFPPDLFSYCLGGVSAFGYFSTNLTTSEVYS